jgi:hypothetical protein
MQLYKRLEHQYQAYAHRCGASLVIIDRLPDQSRKRHVLTQKLLLAGELTAYDMAAFLDLDILIAPNAPSIFHYLPADKDFGAILDPRGTPEFIETWKHIPRILDETSQDYFASRNFALNPNLQGSINGGVSVFRPAAVAGIFADYYYSAHKQGELEHFDEAPMAYLTQSAGRFEPLPIQFNTQVLYKLKGTPQGQQILKAEKWIPKFIRKRYYRKTGHILFPTPAYKKLVQSLLRQNYFVHFAGGFPIPKSL